MAQLPLETSRRALEYDDEHGKQTLLFEQVESVKVLEKQLEFVIQYKPVGQDSPRASARSLVGGSAPKLRLRMSTKSEFKQWRQALLLAGNEVGSAQASPPKPAPAHAPAPGSMPADFTSSAAPSSTAASTSRAWTLAAEDAAIMDDFGLKQDDLESGKQKGQAVAAASQAAQGPKSRRILATC